MGPETHRHLGGGGAALLCVLTALVWLIATQGRSTISREEFNKAVMGKTKDEVIQAIGQPQWSGPDFLYYSSRTHDKATGGVDRTIMVTFDTKTGQCVKVAFTP